MALDRQATVLKPLMQGDTSHLLVRKEHILCTWCFGIEPVHPGSGVPMNALLLGYAAVFERHQPKPHPRGDA